MVEELTRQTQEMRQRLQQEDSRTDVNEDDGVDRRRISTLEEMNLDLLKEMDELRNAIREKTDQSLDKIVKKTDSPFIVAV